MFRKHQDEFGEICYAIRTGQAPQLRHIICSTTPGGGKSMLPIIAASQLIPGFAERICWVVPRRSLQSQAEAEFLKPRVREMLGHNHSVRRSTNEPDPCRGLAGFVTTYQAIGTGNAHLRDEFARRRYVLVLDEPHHLEEGGAWEAALAPLVKRAALTVYMSGTLERGNRKRIAFLPYRDTPDGEIIDLSNNPSTRTISYSRRDALLDKAVLPIHFELMDGTAQWIGRDGETYATTLSGAHKDTAEALYTALKTQFAVHLLDDCAAHWATYRSTHPRSKLLVVTANIEDAKKYVDHLYKGGIRAAIATSDDSAQAARNIEYFKTVGKRRSLDALVTVAMAYEGLDVPAVTHIACLTHIRSKPWIEQMIARATRFDGEAGPWEEQMAYIYVPDDRNMCGIIAGMQDEQVSAIKQLRGDEEDFVLQMPPERGAPGERTTITPVGSQGVGRRWNRVGHVTHENSHGLRETQRTPSQQEADLREKIQAYCKQVDLNFHDRKWGETNKRVVKYFGKPRTAMTLKELQRVMAWLEGNYPIGKPSGKPGPVSQSPIPTASRS
jgi:superfamily II DNA or RNA helicase